MEQQGEAGTMFGEDVDSSLLNDIRYDKCRNHGHDPIGSAHILQRVALALQHQRGLLIRVSDRAAALAMKRSVAWMARRRGWDLSLRMRPEGVLCYPRLRGRKEG